MNGFNLSGPLARDVLNALSASIALIDERGVIVAVNDAWIRFARENGATDEHCFVGDNYLAVCEIARTRGEDEPLARTIDGLRALIAGTTEQVVVDYPCDSPTERRWFAMRATRLSGEAGPGIVVAHEDITARKRAELALEETEHTLRTVLETLPVGVWVMDRTGRITHGNPAGRRIWGGARYVGPEQFGEYKGWWLSTGRPIAADEWAASRAIRKGETSIGEEIEIECFDGSRKIILNSAMPLLDEKQSIQGAIIVNQDITARKHAETELENAKAALEKTAADLAEALERERVLARTDSLTGATNRRHFFEIARREISLATRYEQPLAMLLFDIDDFKKINDTLGHQAGDALLRRVVRSAHEHLRDSDLFARYGGDEFIVVLPLTSSVDAALVAERIRGDVAAQSIVTSTGIVAATISIGIAELLSREDTLDVLIHRADLALYEAKKAGRNRTAVFSPVGSPRTSL